MPEVRSTSVPGISFLPAEDRDSFAEEFQKDIKFLELLILMISKSCATGSVDITWVDENDPDGMRQVLGTTQAARTGCSNYLHWDRPDPSQKFCNVVNDHGRRTAESCAICDKAAEKRVGECGRAEVYRCHAGLSGVAVPVISNGKHIATIYSGQVLTSRHSEQELVQIRNDVRRLSHVDLDELARAYWEVPVVSPGELDDTVRILEMFADHLARTWKRLVDTVEVERQRLRERQLAATEFAYMILQGEIEDREKLTRLLRRLRLTQFPNRVLVVSLEPEEQLRGRISFDLAFHAALHAVEDVAEKHKNIVVAHLRQHGVCVFFRDNSGGASGSPAQTLAYRIHDAVSSRSIIRTRVGIGGLQEDWRTLADSYHEACLALSASDRNIVSGLGCTTEVSELNRQVETACRHIARQNTTEARMEIRALPALANRRLGSGSQAVQRNFFSSALESLCLAAMKAGCRQEIVEEIRDDAHAEMRKAAATFPMQTAFLEGVDAVTDEVERLMSAKSDKTINRIRQMIDRRLKSSKNRKPLTLTEAAAALHVSPPHLSRTFRRITGGNFHDFVTLRRLEYAQRLLLDPLEPVAAIAIRCGFSTPAYFTRVFRKHFGLAPTEFAKLPQAGPK